MAYSPISGKEGSVTVTPDGGSPATFSFDRWKVSMKANLPKVNTFTSAFQQLVTGLTSGTVTCSGPYDAGNMPLVVGNLYEFVLGWNDTISLTVPVLIESIDPEDDVNDAGRVSVTGQSTGSFTAAIT